MLGTVIHDILITGNQLTVHHDLVTDTNPCFFPARVFIAENSPAPS